MTTHRRPSKHIRHVRTRHGRKARVINAHIHHRRSRAYAAPSYADVSDIMSPEQYQHLEEGDVYFNDLNLRGDVHRRSRIKPYRPWYVKPTSRRKRIGRRYAW